MSERRNSNLLRKITILVLVGFVVNTAAALDGSGTQQDPWRIRSLDDFNDFAADANYWNDYTRLETDVNLAGMLYERAIIAPELNNLDYYDFDGIAFTGAFDGNGYKILNLTIDDGGARNSYLGLFGFIDSGEVRSLGLEGGSVSGSYSSRGVGALVGHIESGSISDCYSVADVFGSNRVGGLVGYSAANISSCYSVSDVVVEVGEGVGGLVGINDGSISKCYHTGYVGGGSTHWVGGLAGLNMGNISECYSKGRVVCDDVHWGMAGGLVGCNSGGVSNCYVEAKVSGCYRVGGLVGYNSGGVSKCLYRGLVGGWLPALYIGCLVGYNSEIVRDSFYSANECSWDNGIGTPLWEIVMTIKATFTSVGWDFVGEDINGTDDIWKMIDYHTYPRLSWEPYPMETSMTLTPRIVSCRSKGKWVKAHITLPEGFTAEDVDIDRGADLMPFWIKSSYMDVFINEDELVEIEAGFDRGLFCDRIENEWEDLTVFGSFDDGYIFFGMDTVRINTAEEE